MSTGDPFLDLYHRNLTSVWDSLLPAPDVRIIKLDGATENVDQTIVQIATHYFCNVIQFCVAAAFTPITFTLSAVSSLIYQAPSLSDRVNHPEKFTHPAQVEGHHIPNFGVSCSDFQDGARGTSFDKSSMAGAGTSDWDKLLKRPIQRVTRDGETIGEPTHGITLQEGESLEDLFINVIDHPIEFAKFLKSLGVTAHRTSIERSVVEPKPGEFNDVAIEKYRTLYTALEKEGIKPYVTLHHFTNPQWLEELGGFANEDNIPGFVRYTEKVVRQIPEVKNWMTFNEPGIRALEGHLRGEHPPQHQNVLEAAQVIRNLLTAHIKTYAALKKINPDLNIGLTHQWLGFLPFSNSNPIERITAYFFTSLVHTPIFQFFKEGELHIKIPFKANVQLRYEDPSAAKTQKIADFLGIQAYGYPRVKVGVTNGTPYPGAAGKVNNFTLPWLKIGFTAGSTCEEGIRMQYFGPPAKATDLIHVLDEAHTIPHERISSLGISETGRDAVTMGHGEAGMTSNNALQAAGVHEILAIARDYPIDFVFWWTLHRNCEWISGGLPELGLAKIEYDEANQCFIFKDSKEPAGITALKEECKLMVKALEDSSQVA